MLNVAIAATPQSLEAAAPLRFGIWEFRVDGNSVLEPLELERAVYPFLGPKGDLARVQAAAGALEAVYHDAGYTTVAVVVPEQSLDRGYVRLEVIEQQVDRLDIRGARYFSHRDIREAVPSLQPGTVLNANAIQADLDKLSQRAPDRGIRPVIRGGSRPGLLDVELEVDDRLPLSASVELNNQASANTSDLRLAASLAYNNLFQRQDALSLSYQTAPENTDDVQVFSATYIHRPRWTRGVFSLTGVTTDSDVAAIGDTTVLGKGDFLIGRAVFPLRRSAGLSDALVLGVDYRNSQDLTRFRRDIIEGVVSREEVTDKKIDYVALLAGYNLAHDWLGGRNSYGFNLHAAVRQFGNEREEFEEKRFKGEPNFAYLDFNLARAQPLPWREASLDLTIGGQLTADQLIGNEQMSIGGLRSVRGYLEAERLADYGFNTSVQFNSPLLPLPAGAPGALQGYLFWDWGLGMLHEALPDEDARFALASAGIGLRLNGFFGLDAELTWAHMLRDANPTEAGDDRVLFRLAYGL